MATIVIDPGHGGSADVGRSTWRGAAGGGVLEKEFNLALARRLRARLGAGARLTRDGDDNLSLGERSELARRAGADVFVSIHAHESSTSPGTEVWVHDEGGLRSTGLAQTLADSLRCLGGRLGAVRRARLAVLTPRGLAPRTAACLVEIGGLAAVTAERLRAPDSPLDAWAARIADGLHRFLSTPDAAATLGAPESRAGARYRAFDRRAVGM